MDVKNMHATDAVAVLTNVRTIKEAVADFQKGNLRLRLALTTVKEELKEF